MELTLQKILFPRVDLCARQEMYYRMPAECMFLASESKIVFSSGRELLFDTYFNSFSIGKWRKYTEVQDCFLELDFEGSVIVKVYSAKQINGTTLTQLMSENVFNAPNRSTITVPVRPELNSRIVYFSIQSISGEAVFYGGSYKAEVDAAVMRDIHIAIAICTFKREEHIKRNIDELRQNIIDNQDSPMCGKLDVFISDNAKTLPDDLASEHVHIFPNKNLGGAGGFGRAMIEVFNKRDSLGITHILMMDDDVRIGFDSLIRTCRFLSVLKPEYTGAFVGGHMLKLNEMHIQSEAANYYKMVSQSPVKYNYNLESFDWIVRNEIEDPINYLGWWFCCMPVEVIGEDNLPLPIFIKRDDIEYGLRNGNDFITLNGICVWHEEFYFKSSSYLHYYYMRNMCIVSAKHRPELKANEIWEHVASKVNEKIYTFRYKEAELMLLGIQDFLKGIDWLKAQDGEKLNAAIMKLGYQKQPVDTLEWPFIYGAFARTLNKKESKRQHWIRKATLNGLFLPSKRSVVVNMYQPGELLFYRARRVLNYEDYTRTGFITYRDRDAYRVIRALFRSVRSQFLTKYPTVAKEYATRFEELTNIDFWNEYLYRDGEEPEYTSVLPPMRPPSTGKQRKELWNAKAEHRREKLQFWKPLVPNRVMIEVHKRRGFTCNPKYIALKLIELYGTALELYWVTDYPQDSCEIDELGITVVEADSRMHKNLYQQTKVYITNDSFPAWAVKRPGQVWINTWHAGVNYKHIGPPYIVPKSKAAHEVYMFENRQPDYMISGSEQFAEDTAASFGFDSTIFLQSGLPRNDIYFSNRQEIKEKVKEQCHIPGGVKTVLFAPTFRRGMKSSTYGLDFDQLISSLTQRFGGQWMVLFRNHNFVKSTGWVAGSGVIDVTDYRDMNELLYAVDVLVSDYSSCIYDFALQHKPCFIFANDLQTYASNDRDFAIPIKEWPFDVAITNDELENNIRSFEQDSFSARIQEHMKAVGSFDKGTASEQIAHLIGEICDIDSLATRGEECTQIK